MKSYVPEMNQNSINHLSCLSLKNQFYYIPPPIFKILCEVKLFISHNILQENEKMIKLDYFFFPRIKLVNGFPPNEV